MEAGLPAEFLGGHGERVEIAGRAGATADQQLGGEEPTRATARVVADLGFDRHAEVDHAHAAIVAPQEVLGLEVAVQDAGGMGGLHPRQRLCEPARQHHGSRLLAPRRHPQVGASDELHRDPGVVVRVATGVVHRHDVGIDDPRERSGLAQHLVGPRPRMSAMQDLERHPSLEAIVPRAEHRAHATGAHAIDECVRAQPRRSHGRAEQRRGHRREQLRLHHVVARAQVGDLA